MCGIAGYFDRSTAGGREGIDCLINRMVDTLHHRGPNDRGCWIDPGNDLALGHTRLSIIDLSQAGHQPMISTSGRFVIVYNGEVYNFPALRRDLEKEGTVFRGSSDTEVILEACSTWGVEATVRRLNGMFAFALWDRENRNLVLVRDRIGIKPLYWGWVGDCFAFASELKALCTLPGWREEIDEAALLTYLQVGYVPAPRSIYRNVFKLSPGCMLKIDIEGEPEVSPYWSLRDVWHAGADNLMTGDLEVVAGELDSLLRDAVKRRMVADVPLGAFLSGGIDSSLVVAMMQAESTSPVKSFTIGFDQPGFNEASHAREVAAHLGTEHTELVVTSADTQAVIPNLPTIYDEPLADSSQIPTFLISQLTRQHVTVALSGDGGDELFAGYNRYTWGKTLWSRASKIPIPLRHMVGKGISALPEATWDRLLSWIPGCPSHIGLQLERSARVLGATDMEAVYRCIISQWLHPEHILAKALTHDTHGDIELTADLPGFVERMQLSDALYYLPDDILAKVDRASMAVSLEVRVPLIDFRVAEFAARLSRCHKIHNGKGKWILRRILNKYVPGSLVERPKKGFSIPLATWLRGPIRDWAENLLSHERLKQEGVFAPEAIRSAWAVHLSGQRNLAGPLWCILMFQAWLEHRMSERSSSRQDAGSCVSSY